MRRDGDTYEYIAVYTDDLAIASRNPQAIIDALEKGAGFKLKGVGTIEYHLGCDYTRDKDGTLCCGPKGISKKWLQHTSKCLEKHQNSSVLRWKRMITLSWMILRSLDRMTQQNTSG
jgi:hypothetical protein